ADSISPLTTKGKEIQKDGKNFQLKGVNAGNAFTTEGYLGGITGKQYEDYPKPYKNKTYKELKEKLDDEFGPKEAKKKLNTYANNHWTDEDFQNVKDMGLNTIRLPINYINVTNYKKGMDPKDVEMNSHSFDAIDKFVEKAKEHGLYVIIDLHGAPYSQNGEEHSADSNHGNKDNGESWDGHFWDTDDQDASTSKKVADAQGKTKEILHNIAKHYKDEDAIAGYDVLNEPKGQSEASHKPKPDPQVNQFYKDAVKSIRDSGDKHIIFLEGIWNPDNLKDPSYYKDTAHNLVYEYHNYATKEDGSVRESFDKKLDNIKNSKFNVPSYLGEFSIQSMKDGPNANSDDLKHIVNKANKNNLSWTIWNNDVQGDGNWGVFKYDHLNEDPKSPDFGKKSGVQENSSIYNAIKDGAK
ncbi:hypothetical protein D0399_06225, partial [Staphylococcus epidermidis]|uniref:glycoside hydrolase family 5 protein n=2 Tax=Staphylococcus epidermidis TaxID=1282 RepID=UPI0019341863